MPPRTLLSRAAAPVAALLVAALGCASAPNAGHAQARAAPPPVGRINVQPPRAASCEASFEAARRRGVCHYGDASCTYAEGACACEAPPQCGGARRPDPYPGQELPWRCVPSARDAVQENGCPYQQPAEGSRCGRPGLRCDYGPCFWNNAFASCDQGRWRTGRTMSPPPP